MKKISLVILLLQLFLWLSACSNSENASKVSGNNSVSEDSTTILEIKGMIRLEGGNLTLGSDDEQFKANERPAMKVKLNYSFFMGIHEVTCGEYNTLAKKENLKDFGPCEHDSLPLTDVTYFDALLYANAKSKAEGFDTVYTYSEPTFDSEGHCTNLEGIKTHTNVEGFRLPTEAEWIYGATRDWNTEKAWYNKNSDYKLHKVCAFDPTGSDFTGFCDMAGNALEWVNDWLGVFHDTTVTNYAGAPDGGDLGERVVKGGCYSSSISEVNPYSRGDVYTVTSSTRAEYVGFRLAFGAIPNPVWINKDGSSVASQVTPLVNSETIRDIAGSYNVKLVFRNDVTGNIGYLNFKNGSLTVEEISKGIEAYHPEISPNGKWVAFCTGMEGISGNSSLYVLNLERKSAAIKLDVESAAIPRWHILDNGDTAIVYVTDAGNNMDESAFKSTSTWQVRFAGGKFGKPQKLFDGAYHGGISEDEKLTVSGARILRARVSGHDTTWYNSEQACNVSLSQDSAKRIAFLDFGGDTGKEFVGSNYSTHQRILVADSTGKLIDSYGAPNGYTFDHSEWASDGKNSLIVATLTNANGAHTKIALVNPADSSVTEIVEGNELWHPNLWIRKLSEIDDDSYELNPDSAGIYYTSGADYVVARWRYKMEILWQYKDSANVVILGSSRALLGINPLYFKKPFYAINLSNTSNIKHGSKFLFRNYVIPHVKKLKYVIISVDLDRWYHDDDYSFFYQGYREYPGYVYDADHSFWADSVPDQLFDYTYESLGNSKYGPSLRETRGYQTTNSQGWETDDVPIKKDSSWYKKNSTIYYKHYNYLVDIVKKAAEHNITVIGVEMPESPAYRETGSYGKYGLLRSQMPELLQEIKDISKTYPNFIFFDENKMGNHDYSDDMAQNADHLATLGATRMSQRLDSLLRTLE